MGISSTPIYWLSPICEHILQRSKAEIPRIHQKRQGLNMNKNLHPVVREMHLLANFRAGEMLRITSDKKKGKVVLTVEGRIAGPWVGTLEQCWRELRAASPDEKFSINLCGVSFIDPAGKTLLKEIYRQGGQLVAEGCLNHAIVREIKDTGGKNEGGADKEGRGPKGSPIGFYIALFSLLLTPGLM